MLEDGPTPERFSLQNGQKRLYDTRLLLRSINVISDGSAMANYPLAFRGFGNFKIWSRVSGQIPPDFEG